MVFTDRQLIGFVLIQTFIWWWICPSVHFNLHATFKQKPRVSKLLLFLHHGEDSLEMLSGLCLFLPHYGAAAACFGYSLCVCGWYTNVLWINKNISFREASRLEITRLCPDASTYCLRQTWLAAWSVILWRWGCPSRSVTSWNAPLAIVWRARE